MSFLEPTTYNWSWFNGLSAIEVADEEMHDQNKLGIALSALGPIFMRYEVCDTWGISLLHKHWPLEDGERPVQEAIHKNGEMQFVTRPRALHLSGPHAPSVFRVAPGPHLDAIEFSTDHQVFSAHDALSGKPDFVNEFCRAVVANNLQDTFGLIANKLIDDEEWLVEFNYAGRMSVLRRSTTEDPKEGRYIQTSWRFAKDASGIDCHFRCLSSCQSSTDGHIRNHPPDHGVDT